MLLGEKLGLLYGWSVPFFPRATILIFHFIFVPFTLLKVLTLGNKKEKHTFLLYFACLFVPLRPIFKNGGYMRSYFRNKYMKIVTMNSTRVLLMLVMLVTPVMMVWSQELNKKFSITTQMFLDELQQQKQQPANSRHRVPARRVPDGSLLPEPEPMIASPDTLDGVPYISCVVHLNDVNDQSAVRAIGVKVQATFNGFITASVPVDQLNALANVDNVTMINVAQLMRPSTDVSRQVTNVDDLLTGSASAIAQGVNSMYDGTGVVLGIIDTGIDFQHIAFKDKGGNSRIKRAYVYNGSGTGTIYTSIDGLTTDNDTGDHGTHTASTAGGSSVIVNKIDNDNFEISVTDDHAQATYGGMAPGADLYLAGLKSLKDTEIMTAMQKIAEYADSVGKPLVVSNSWGSSVGPRDGTGEIASVVSQYFGDAHPNHIILFSSANNAGHSPANEGGGFFVKKNDASNINPLGTIIRTRSYDGNYYKGVISVAYSNKPLNCSIIVLDNRTGNVIMRTSQITNNTSFTDPKVSDGETTTTYYTGKLNVYVENPDEQHNLIYLYSSGGFTSEETDAYTLAVQVYPAGESDSGEVNMWAGQETYFTNHLTTNGFEWTNGTDDMSVADEATIPNAISVGAYMSKNHWENYENKGYKYNSANEQGDIAIFSSYATAELSPTREAYPWITGPGAMVMAGVNHYHSIKVDANSFFGESKKPYLVVNNETNPYGGMQGTSMSCPTVAGIVALWLQAAKGARKDLTVNDVKDIMRRTAINDGFTTTGVNASHFGQGKIDALAGIQYITGKGISLADNAYNDTKISRNADGSTTNVMLYGRTLWKDGAWNTLCLPFNLTLSGSVLDGADVRALSSTSLVDGTLTLNFTAQGTVTELVAGTPYIIKWSGNGTNNLVNPTFENVTISSITNDFISDNISFKGTNAPISFTEENRSVLFMGGNNKLYYPDGSSAITMGAFRSYFEIGSAGEDISNVKAFVLNFDGVDDADGICGLTPASSPRGEIYNLAGQRLNMMQKGINIINGKKILK